ncbi:MAG TPA: tetratricopeptide repeat protein [Gammaproteobacteria bacterium]|jgi:tetratricopeptide (TPR) repeat protein
MRKASILILVALAYAGFASAATAPTPAPVSATAAQQAAAKAQNENALITQEQSAQSAKDWPKAETLLNQLTAMDPGNWQFHQALGDVRLNEGKYEEAAHSYATALVAAGKAEATPAIHQAMAIMYSNEGTAYEKLKKDDEAFKAYTQAAQLSDTPATTATAWNNACVAGFNASKGKEALDACNKALAADPTKANAWFIKGSILMGDADEDASGKPVPVAGTVEAFKKYLALEPKGPHAADAQQMLDYLSGKSP